MNKTKEEMVMQMKDDYVVRKRKFFWGNPHLHACILCVSNVQSIFFARCKLQMKIETLNFMDSRRLLLEIACVIQHRRQHRKPTESQAKLVKKILTLESLTNPKHSMAKCVFMFLDVYTNQDIQCSPASTGVTTLHVIHRNGWLIRETDIREALSILLSRITTEWKSASKSVSVRKLAWNEASSVWFQTFCCGQTFWWNHRKRTFEVLLLYIRNDITTSSLFLMSFHSQFEDIESNSPSSSMKCVWHDECGRHAYSLDSSSLGSTGLETAMYLFCHEIQTWFPETFIPFSFCFIVHVLCGRFSFGGHLLSKKQGSWLDLRGMVSRDWEPEDSWCNATLMFPLFLRKWWTSHEHFLKSSIRKGY